LAALAALILGGLSCGSSTQSREPDEYTGCGTDENWRTFDDQEHLSTVADATAPQFTSPAPMAMIPSAEKPIVQWNQDPNDPGANDGDVPYMGIGCNDCCPEFNPGALTSLHLPPISGDVYDLQFVVGGSVDHRVITTLQEWTPPDALWSSWKGKTVGIKIWRMNLLHNDVKAGPFTPMTPFSFSVTN
jgi:hypothetical protein